MLRLRGTHSNKVQLKCFFDSDTGDTFGPDEFKLAKNVLQEGHYLEAHYSDGDDGRIYSSAQVIWIGENRFKTQYKTFRYK